MRRTIKEASDIDVFSKIHELLVVRIKALGLSLRGGLFGKASSTFEKRLKSKIFLTAAS